MKKNKIKKPSKFTQGLSAVAAIIIGILMMINRDKITNKIDAPKIIDSSEIFAIAFVLVMLGLTSLIFLITIRKK